ncbi:polyketide cyclase / dehydrase and lipid transport [Arthrobacter sp. PM3]|uniref:polyketide cyclase / dehydrase and lipid transport n=1 Tax=Arthrobacter sp. PM3 TaxID=2017685 RepID=UPI000E10A69E|nr:polyketide cyclase / dehydrase and lipid transport [Arthrobacter sp. PM3]AXJ10126.1 polyketide cyclase / dehydrase and lipid transport [Arthrobacter sp. PM3]
MKARYLVSRSRFIAAAPDAIFDVLATPALHSVIDGSDTVKGARPRGPARLYLGAKFGMQMRMRVNYKILNRVCEFEEGHRIAWRHFYGHVWRYLLEPATGPGGTAGTMVPGTMVTEQWDARRVRGKSLLRLAGYLRRHPVNLEQTLAKLDAYMAAHGDLGNVEGRTNSD